MKVKRISKKVTGKKTNGKISAVMSRGRYRPCWTYVSGSQPERISLPGELGDTCRCLIVMNEGLQWHLVHEGQTLLNFPE